MRLQVVYGPQIGNEFIDFDYDEVSSDQQKFFHFGYQLFFGPVVDYFIKRDITFLGNIVQNPKNFRKNLIFSIFELSPQLLKALLSIHVEKLNLGSRYLVTGAVDVYEHLLRTQTHREGLLVDVCSEPVEYFK